MWVSGGDEGKMKAKIFTWTAVIVLSVVLGGAAVVGLDSLRGDRKTSSTASPVIQNVTSRSTNISNSAVQDVADLYANVRPSIVRVTGSNTRNGSGGLGSGIVIDNKGYILTNNHVVNGFDKIDVTTADGTATAATVVGTDPGNDLAVVKVDMPADKLKPATLGDSDQARVGD